MTVGRDEAQHRQLPRIEVVLNISLRRTVVAGLGFAASASLAQSDDSSASTAEQPGFSLEEIVVTAERREADLQDTPISMVSMNANEIEQTGASSLDELSDFIPNLNITYSGSYGRSNPEFNIRGVGQGVITDGVVTERPVGLYIDGLYYSRVQGSLLSLIDAERIEVLRGPQGTLFGRNTTGGAIVYTSRSPSSEFEGSVDVKVGDFGQSDLKVVVNLPIGDTFAVRATAATLEKDGYVHRGAIDLGNVDDEVERVQARWEPSGDLQLDLTYTHSLTRTNGDARDISEIQLHGLPVGGAFQALELLLMNQGEPRIVEDDPRFLLDDFHVADYCILDDTNPFTFGPECDTSLRGELDVFSSKFVWEIHDELTLTSITGGLSGTQESNNDWVWTGGYRRPWGFDFENFSQELQLNWNVGDLQMVGGIIYFSEDARETEVTTEITRGSGSFALTDADILAGRQITRRHETYQSKVDSYGVFAQGTWSLMQDRLDVTAGVRSSSDDKEVHIHYIPTPDDPRDETGGGSASWSDTDWRLATSYYYSDDLMIYASATDAYKAGIADDSSLENRSNTENLIAFIPPERALGYEMGLRSEWLQNRLRSNLSLYTTDYTNRQSSRLVTDPTSGILVIQSISLGDVTYRGYEADVAYAVSGALQVSGSVGVSKPDAEDNPDALPASPELSWTLGLSHALSMGSGASLNSSLRYAWVDETFMGGSAGTAPSWNPSYGLLSGRVEYTAPTGVWSLALYGTNLLDEVYSTNSAAQTFHIGFGDRAVTAQYRGRPRSFGLHASVRFPF